MSKSVTRLFEQFQPEHYDLELTFDKGKLTFNGSVTVRGRKVGRPSERITFHQKDLKITEVKLTKLGKDLEVGKDIKVARINSHKSFDELRIHTAETLYPGEYTITVQFSGTISDAMNGLYPSRYKDKDGNDQIILGTQFESHHAREVFPCIDEPEAKATFGVAITAGKGEVILGNTPVKAEKTTGATKTVTFEKTPIMSSYLLAFVVGDLKYLEAKTKDGVLIRTYATPDNVDQTDFALDVGVKVLEFYNDYFAIPYPLPKLDMVALPDFASGAMENWGLVTYREQALLVDPKNTSVPMKQWVAMVVAHELAHQWFGNLVTMRWWTDLWLNEGFASWIEYMAVDHIFPEWQMWTQFIAEEQQAALRLDALENTHPIEVPIKHPDEIRTIFDTISYAKGSSVIHMLHAYLGPDAFRGGLRAYLKQHAYKNTDTVDLWTSLSDVSGKDVKAFMHSWTAEPGFPAVTLQGDTITQERFYLVPPEKSQDTMWHIPLMAEPQQKIDVLSKPSVHVDKNTLLNTGRSGFYRVAYDEVSSKTLDDRIAKGTMQPADRLGLLSDSFEVVKAGYSGTVSALHLLAAYKDEDNAAVWDIMSSALGDVRTVMGSDEELREAMKPFVAKLVAKQLKRLGWEPKQDEPHFDTLLRPTILGLAAFADVPEVINEINKRFKAAKKPEDTPPDLRSIIWNTVARFGGQKEFDTFLKWHNESTNSELRVTLSAALTGFKDPKLTARALELIKTDKVRNQDAAYWVIYALANRWGRDTAWAWMKDNWDWLEENLGSDLAFARFPVYAARVFTGDNYLKEYRQFFEPKVSPTLERSIKQGLEIIQWHTAWYNRDHDKVIKYFRT